MVLREIYTKSFFNKPYPEIVLRTGVSINTLVDVRAESSAGCFHFSTDGDGKSFIIWRAVGEWLYLDERSLDYELVGSCLALRLENSVILPGTSIFDSGTHIQILVPTAASVHRFAFPRSSRFNSTVTSTTHRRQSIFAGASLTTIQAGCHLLGDGAVAFPHTGCAALHSQSQEALFALGCSDGSIWLITMPPVGRQGKVNQEVFRSSSVIRRLSAWITKSGSSDELSGDYISGLCLQETPSDVLMHCVTGDCRLQVWSCKQKRELRTIEVWRYLPELKGQSFNPSKLSLKHRIIYSPIGEEPYLVMYAFSDVEPRFMILKPQYDPPSSVSLTVLSQIAGAETSLIDFALLPNILITLSVTAENDAVVEYLDIELPDGQYGVWNVAEMALTQAERFGTGRNTVATVGNNELAAASTPQDICTRIFCDGLFSFACVLKALKITTRGVPNDVEHGDWRGLRSIAINSLGMEMLDHTQCDESLMITEDAYRDALENWQRFYSACLQYHAASSRPLGLLAAASAAAGSTGSQEMGFTGVIRQELFTVLYPKDDFFEDIDQANSSLVQSMHGLLAGCSSVEDVLIEEVTLLPQLDAIISGSQVDQLWPEVVRFVTEQLIQTGFFKDITTRRIGRNSTFREAISHIGDSLKIILGFLEVDKQLGGGGARGGVSAMDHDNGGDDDMDMDTTGVTLPGTLKSSPVVSWFLSSGSGSELLASCVRETIVERERLCRNLCLLLGIFDILRTELGLSTTFHTELRGDWSYRLCSLWQHYRALKWLSNAVLADDRLEKKTSLDRGAMNVNEKAILPTNGISEISLLHGFINGENGHRLRRQLSDYMALEPMVPGDVSAENNFERKFSYLLLVSLKAMWPSSREFQMLEFMMNRGQYQTLAQYCDQLSFVDRSVQCCIWFFSGCALLNLNQPEEAYEAFKKAGTVLERPDSLLMTWLISKDRPSDEELANPRAFYVMKLIRLFESLDVPQLVVKLARDGLATMRHDDPNMTVLWTLLFKCHLEAKCCEEAFTALQKNPDTSSQKACLRQWVISLMESKQVTLLISSKYVTLEREVVDIMVSRARAVDLAQHDHYKLIYIFFMHRKNYRKAAHYMYECARRLAVELRSIESLQCQVNCYLATVNALSLVNEKYAWLAVSTQSEATLPSSSPKRSHDDELLTTSRSKPDTTVVDMKQLKKEHMVVNARLTVARQKGNLSIGSVSPAEVISDLLACCEYDMAISLATAYDLPTLPVLESLTAKCISCSFHHDAALSSECKELDWLDNNKTLFQSSTLSFDTLPSDSVWRLLSAYLQYLSLTTTPSVLYRCVASKLISSGHPVPAWFLNEYKKVDAGELIRIYTEFGQIDEAQRILCGYIDAVMGVAPEHFGLANSIQATSKPVWIPYSITDQLLILLQHAAADDKDPHHHSSGLLLKELEAKLAKYFQILESNNRIFLQEQRRG